MTDVESSYPTNTLYNINTTIRLIDFTSKKNIYMKNILPESNVFNNSIYSRHAFLHSQWTITCQMEPSPHLANQMMSQPADLIVLLFIDFEPVRLIHWMKDNDHKLDSSISTGTDCLCGYLSTRSSCSSSLSNTHPRFTLSLFSVAESGPSMHLPSPLFLCHLRFLSKSRKSREWQELAEYFLDALVNWS